ncbi:hypothetical protein OIU78_001651 [Salix suchowensis]|nr:hypothetical protein OIU78_001651 [Salix suchowensis]KAJ6369326.1 hypothetical protein OIU78_001651 [Salix suchowensis]
MQRTMRFILKQALLFFLLYVVFSACILAESDSDNSVRLRSAPHKNVRSIVIDGSGTENADDFDGTSGGLEERKGGYNRVSISTVALFTLAMAVATGLGAVPFFFVELDPHWEGLCGGMAAGVMLAASFDLIQEGQSHGAGSWVVIGILSGGIFILLCKKFLEQYGEVSMLDIEGADATKVVLVIGIMTLHSFGEGFWCWCLFCWLKRLFSRTFGNFGHSRAQHTGGVSCEHDACIEGFFSAKCNVVECNHILASGNALDLIKHLCNSP